MAGVLFVHVAASRADDECAHAEVLFLRVPPLLRKADAKELRGDGVRCAPTSVFNIKDIHHRASERPADINPSLFQR